MQWDFVQERDPRIKSLSNLQMMMRTLAGTKYFSQTEKKIIFEVVYLYEKCIDFGGCLGNVS